MIKHTTPHRLVSSEDSSSSLLDLLSTPPVPAFFRRITSFRPVRAALAFLLLGLIGAAQATNYTTTPLIPAGHGRGGLAVAPNGAIGELVTAGNGLLYRGRANFNSAPGDWKTIAVHSGASAPLIAFEAHLSFTQAGRGKVIFFERQSTKSNYRELSEISIGDWKETRTWNVGPAEGASVVFVPRGNQFDALELGYSNSEHAYTLLYRRLSEGDGNSTETIDRFDRPTTLQAFETPLSDFSYPRSLSAALDKSGRLHVVYSKNQFVAPVYEGDKPIGTEVRSSLFYSRREPGGGWSAPRELNSPGGEFGDGGIGACIAAAPDGTVAIAAVFLPRVRTGSTAPYAELRYFVLQPDGSWPYSVVASRSDNYVAGDGERGTGLEPWLVFDSNSRPRIVFTDHASEHMPSGWSYSGQLRLAKRSSATSGDWEVSTILPRGNKSAIDFTIWRPALAVDRGNTYLACTSFTWIDNGIYTPEYRFFTSRPGNSLEAFRSAGGWQAYVAANADVFNYGIHDEAAAFAHWRDHGLKEGRIFDNGQLAGGGADPNYAIDGGFTWKYADYAGRQGDMVVFITKNAGKPTGWDGPALLLKKGDRFNLGPAFSASAYRILNPDVAQAIDAGRIPNFSSVTDHYVKYGFKEGRLTNGNWSQAEKDAWNDDNYLSVNTDVRDFFQGAQGQGWKTLGKIGFAHYMNFGRWEGRGGLAFRPPVMVNVAGGILPVSSDLRGTAVQNFRIGRYEVTWDEWQVVRAWAVANGYSDLADVGEGGAWNANSHPVQEVSWYDAVKWCNALSEREGLVPVYYVDGTVYRRGNDVPRINTSANGYRLPSEAEWEWAARGGVNSLGYKYSGSNDVNAVAWYWENSMGAPVNLYYGRGTWPVGQKTANELGLHDMSGNVWEWCQDSGPASSYRRIRGGYWYNVAHNCAVADRGSNDGPDYRDDSVGFRLARSSGQ